MSEIKNKTALITGGASGIGKLLAFRLIEQGIKQLVLWDKNEKALIQTADQIRKQNFEPTYFVVDIADTNKVIEAAKKVKEKIGKIDILINNAGVVVGKEFYNHTHQEIDFVMDINSSGMMHVTLEFLNDMIKQGSGHLVNIASAAGYVANPKMSVYVASKWAVIGWSESLRIELERISKNLHVTTVTPYYINTGMFEGVKSNFLLPILNPEKITNSIIKAIRKNKIFVREPFLIKFTPLVKGILPARLFDLFAGKILGVYKTMDGFTGRNKQYE